MKRIVVTGASSGIGEAVARELGQRHRVVLVARREERLREIAAELPHAVALPLDLSLEEWEGVLAESVRGDGEVVLVHCAGAANYGPTAEMASEVFLEQIEINLTSFAKACRALLPEMLRARKGHIVGVFSVAAVHAFPGAAAYCASKAGAYMFARSLAEEVRREGIRVTSVLPGATDTPLWGDQSPPREKMLSAQAVAEAIAVAVESPVDRSYDEIRIMPPDGVL